MDKITLQDFQDKLVNQSEELSNEDGETYLQAPPNELIKENGKPDLVRAFYNNRWYCWELVA